ncbi:MAG: tetratricopeptide repeat protein [Paludibacteraceae bacterium]
MKNKEKIPPWTEWNSSDIPGKALWSAGNFPDAQEYFFKQIKQSEAIKDTFGILRAYFNLGELNIEEGDYKEVIHHLKTTLPFDNGQKVYSSRIVGLFEDLAKAYKKTNNLDSALY